MPLEQEFTAIDKGLHDLKSFDCGKGTMNEFLVRYAIKHGKLGLSRSYVLTEKHTSPKKTIVAYYTLAVSTVTRAELPTTQSLPGYPVPVIILARLAVDKRHQGIGLGAKSLIYALRHTSRLSASGLPAYGLIVDVLDKSALAFYQCFEMFIPFTDNPMRLFVPMKTLDVITAPSIGLDNALVKKELANYDESYL